MIGTFIRPVGPYQYCYQVIDVKPYPKDGIEQWWCKRWGMGKDHQPLDDGRGNAIHYISNLKRVANGVWRDFWRNPYEHWSCRPMYYRRIDVQATVNSAGQMSLF